MAGKKQKLFIDYSKRNKHAIESLNKYLDLLRDYKTTEEACKELGISKWAVITWENKLRFSENEEEKKLYREYLDLYNGAIKGQKDLYFMAIGLKMLEYREQGLHWVEIAAKFSVTMGTMNRWKSHPVIAEMMEIAEPKYNTYWLSKLRNSMDNAKSNTGLVMYAMGKYIGLYEGMSLDDRFNITSDESQKAVFERITKLIEKQIVEKVTLEQTVKKQIEEKSEET